MLVSVFTIEKKKAKVILQKKASPKRNTCLPLPLRLFHPQPRNKSPFSRPLLIPARPRLHFWSSVPCVGPALHQARTALWWGQKYKTARPHRKRLSSKPSWPEWPAKKLDGGTVFQRQHRTRWPQLRRTVAEWDGHRMDGPRHGEAKDDGLGQRARKERKCLAKTRDTRC